MKTKEELNALKEEVETVSRKLHELTPEELEKVNGGFFMAGFIGSQQMDYLKDASATAIYGAKGAN